MNCAEKILSPESLLAWRQRWRESGRRLAVTNGCFDLLHAGHVTYLEAARNQADALLVGINSDATVRELKGPGRPVNSENDRALVIAALASVDGVFVFREPDAVTFLDTVRPDIYVKGGDYTLETINQNERRLIESNGGKIVLLAHVPGKSTTGLLKKLENRSN
jgi:rfaE bifunctional protein nucleotidyltransferase chain/domain